LTTKDKRGRIRAVVEAWRHEVIVAANWRQVAIVSDYLPEIPFSVWPLVGECRLGAMTMYARLNLLICVAVLCLGGCMGTPRAHNRPHGHQDTTLAMSPQDDGILFNAAGTGGRDLYLLQLPDLKVLRIADTAEYEVAPCFSSDGKSIVYAAGVPNDRADHVFTMARDGTAKTQLTHADGNDTSPSFSPDGSMIVFARSKTYHWGGLGSNWSGGGVICLIRTDGTNLRQLTSDGVFADKPRFTLDGKSIIYSTSNGRALVPVDGSAAPQAMPGPFGAVLSPDSTLMAYSQGEYSLDRKIFIARADGTSERVLTPKIGGCYGPVFLHRGNRLYFLREEWPDGPTGVPKSSIWEATVDGASVREIADSLLFDDPLAWKPKRMP
jgi:hypothetical protein